ncbi:MAG: MBL fold metallo-hydrolase [Phycisphaerae bacterium]|nr:MBL fold metallo-hydrolase [Phycisphaerae bacterium]
MAGKSADRTARVDIISIGTLSRNRLWEETVAIRTPHSTCTLIRVGDRSILVDPGLPPQIIAARLAERTGLLPEKIDTVFLTNFRPSHRGGVAAFGRADFFIHEHERASARRQLEALLDDAPEADLDRTVLEAELKLLSRCKPAEDKLAPNVDLFPLFGFTPGTCGLLVSSPTSTLMIAGDAIPTREHLLAGQVLPESQNIEAAQESMREVYEIADLIVPGHDNWFANPRHLGL